MTFKLYTKLSLGILFSSILLIIGVNYLWNPYGLFGNVKGKEIKIIEYEKSSKYLMSFNYIPQNFEGLLVGPSLSANLNTKNIKDYKIYNISMAGANISELKMAVNNVIKFGNLKFIIFCLDPYLTKDYGMKSSQINIKEYWGSLGSINTIKLLKANLNKKKQFEDSTYGYNNFNLKKKKLEPKEEMLKSLEKIKSGKSKFYDLNEKALKEMHELIKYAESKNIKLFAYIYPRYYEVYNLQKEKYDVIYKKQTSLFNNNLTFFNFNDSKFDKLRKNYNSYSDGSHLSDNGAKMVLEEIEFQLNKYYKSNK